MNLIQGAAAQLIGTKAVPGIAKATAAGSNAASTAAANTAGTTTAGASDAAADRFLTLLVTQLQNQDPLNPLDNAQLISQLAQINTVSGINKLNDTLSTLAASINAGQYLQSIGLVGHQVVLQGDGLTLAEGQARGGVELAAPASASVAISDASGRVVRTIDLGKLPAGDSFFTWDGKTDAGAAAASGHYTFAITATAGGKPATATGLSLARVQGVTPTASGAQLALADGTTVDLSQVRQIQ